MEQIWWTAFVDFEHWASRPQRACVIVRPENLRFVEVKLTSKIAMIAILPK